VFVLDPVIDLVNDRTPLFAPWGRVVVVVALFATAWLVSRFAAVVARRVLAWHERRHEDGSDELLTRVARRPSGSCERRSRTRPSRRRSSSRSAS
jgi:hypothetical protein